MTHRHHRLAERLLSTLGRRMTSSDHDVKDDIRRRLVDLPRGLHSETSTCLWKRRSARQPAQKTQFFLRLTTSSGKMWVKDEEKTTAHASLQTGQKASGRFYMRMACGIFPPTHAHAHTHPVPPRPRGFFHSEAQQSKMLLRDHFRDAHFLFLFLKTVTNKVCLKTLRCHVSRVQTGVPTSVRSLVSDPLRDPNLWQTCSSTD